MSQINLLPWREWEREAAKRSFIIIMFAVVALAIFCVLMGSFYLKNAVNVQEQRNKALKTGIDNLDLSISQIQDLESTREALLGKIEVVGSLQLDRPVIVHVFDQLVRTLVEDVYYKDLRYQESEKRIYISGVAKTNSKISNLMRNFQESEWFTGPNLKAISENKRLSTRANDFQLTVDVVNASVKRSKELAK